jgi:hypothetical protein
MMRKQAWRAARQTGSERPAPKPPNPRVRRNI